MEFYFQKIGNSKDEKSNIFKTKVILMNNFQMCNSVYQNTYNNRQETENQEELKYTEMMNLTHSCDD